MSQTEDDLKLTIRSLPGITGGPGLKTYWFFLSTSGCMHPFIQFNRSMNLQRKEFAFWLFSDLIWEQLTIQDEQYY